MNRTLLLTLAAFAFFASHGFAAGAAVRGVILPPTVTQPQQDLKEDSLAIADFLQTKLGGFPDVDWLERSDLDKLSAEAKLAPAGGGGASAIALGRMLKAEVVLCGYLERAEWKTINGKEAYTAAAALQVIDLTNASVLAEKSWERAERMEGPISAGELEAIAETARGLLDAALAERRAAAAALVLAPVFFANSGPSARLDHWEEKWQQALREEARALPGVRLLRFPGVEQARGEQKLALLGLTEADPSAWQHAANGYVWGTYQELPTQQTTAFEETEAEAELFLWMGQGEPKRFSRRFAVKDFPQASRALGQEVLRSAMEQTRPPTPPEAGAQVAKSVFARLCALIGEGFFTSDPPLKSLLPPFSGMGAYGEAVLAPFKRLPPQARRQKLAYCRRMLDLACFFDPSDHRRQMLRWTVSNPREAEVNPDNQLEPVAECIEWLELLVRDREFDVAAFISGADAVMNRLVYWQKQGGWYNDEKGPNGEWGVMEHPPAHLPARRQELLESFYPLLVKQLPALSQQLDEAKVPTANRRFLSLWLQILLLSDAKPEIRLQYLEAARSATPRVDDFSAAYERLMRDLGDRKRVQSALMKPELQEDRASLPPAHPRPARPDPPQTPPDADEPLLAGVTPLPTLRMRMITLRLEELRDPVEGNARPVLSHTLADRVAALSGARSETASFSVRTIEGFGDQLLIGLDTSLEPAMRGAADAYLLYQASADAVQALDISRPELLCKAGSRVLYRTGEAAGWRDLLSSESGQFFLEKGFPVASPSMIGFDGAGRAAVAGGKSRTAGLFDWDKGQWLTLPAPPPAAPSAPLPPAGQAPNPRPAQTAAKVLATGDLIVFPLWNLVFDQTAQSWRELPADACLPPGYAAPPSGHGWRVGPGDAFCVDGHLWSWNQGGISDFSLKENRVVWHADAQKLVGVCPDGPYLWVAFGPRILRSGTAPPQMRYPTLALLDQERHTVLGAVKLPRDGASLYAGEQQLWMGFKGTSFSSSVTLLCADKAKLYAALNQAPSSLSDNPKKGRPVFKDANLELYAAILRNDPAAVSLLLGRGASASSALGPGHAPALLLAAWTGNEALCRLLIQRGAKADASPPGGKAEWNALTAAARRGNRAVLGLLLQSGAKATETALSEALLNDDFESAQMLIKAGAPLEKLPSILAQEKNEDMARRVLALQLPLPPEDRTQLALLAKATDVAPALGDNPKRSFELIIEALRQKQWDQAVKLVEQVPAAQLQGKAAREAFLTAISSGSLQTVHAFLDRGISPTAVGDERVPQERGPLDTAIKQPEVFALLLQRGADPHATDHQKETFAERAAKSPCASATLLSLLKYYPDPYKPFGYGTFGGALLCATVIGPNHPSTAGGRSADAAQALQTLIESGVPPSAAGREGFSALHAAFAVRNPSLACALAGLGADLRARDLAGRTVLDAPYLLVGQRYGFVEKLRAYAPKGLRAEI